MTINREESRASLEASEASRLQARAAGKAASIYGYPLVETIRRCRLETEPAHHRTDAAIPLIDEPSSVHFHGDVDPVDGPTLAWVYLGDGPRKLGAGGVGIDAGLLSLHDAWAQCFGRVPVEGLGTGVWIVGPRADVPLAARGCTVYRSTSSFCRIAVQPVDGLSGGRPPWELARCLRITGLPDTLNRRRPAAVELWEGDESDAFTDVLERGESPSSVAPRFYANLCRALAHSPPRHLELQLVNELREFGLSPNGALNWTALPRAVRQGLELGFADAAHAVSACANLLRCGKLGAAWMDQHARSLLYRAAALRAGPFRSKGCAACEGGVTFS
ncbi:MAG: hypothetical protein JSR41_02955 [Proteobacteria bacterium]|nr:hypothetical protein [Pseudomonadota bacterium]